MLFVALFTSIVALVSATIQLSGKRCSKHLAEIVYEPCNQWSKYLRSISVELRDIATFYETSLGNSIIYSFQQKYGVTVVLYEPFGEYLDYSSNPATESAQTQFDHNNARAVLNLGAFYQDGTDFIFSFLSFAKNGQMVEVSLIKPIST
jgi:hypothetical protein